MLSGHATWHNADQAPTKQLRVGQGPYETMLWVPQCRSGPTKPLLTNPYFEFLQILDFFVMFLGFVGAMAMAKPWPQAMFGLGQQTQCRVGAMGGNKAPIGPY